MESSSAFATAKSYHTGSRVECPITSLTLAVRLTLTMAEPTLFCNGKDYMPRAYAVNQGRLHMSSTV